MDARLNEAPTLAVEVWSDIACPWCYVGKRRLEAALSRFAHREAVALSWRSFELDPAAPRVSAPVTPYAQRLATKYGMPLARAEDRIQQLTDVAAADGLELRFDRVRPGNTFDAHRLLHLAAERGRQDVLKERLLRAYFTEGEAIGDPGALTRLGGDAGLDPDEVRAVLAADTYARDVRSDEERARALGIHGVPFFVLGGRYGLSGAQPAEVLLQSLDQAWADLEQRADPPVQAGPACGPDGCA
jgi:predicted DsbA family dithiol-disulfide isomerase